MKSLLVALMILFGATAAQAQQHQIEWYTVDWQRPGLITGPFLQKSDCDAFRQYFQNIGFCYWAYRENVSAVVYHFYNPAMGLTKVGPFGSLNECRAARNIVVGGTSGPDCWAGYTRAAGVGLNWFFARAQHAIGPFAHPGECEMLRKAQGGFAACWRN